MVLFSVLQPLHAWHLSTSASLSLLCLISCCLCCSLKPGSRKSVGTAGTARQTPATLMLCSCYRRRMSSPSAAVMPRWQEMDRSPFVSAELLLHMLLLGGLRQHLLHCLTQAFRQHLHASYLNKTPPRPSSFPSAMLLAVGRAWF